jgi:anti-anti-sigma factor
MILRARTDGSIVIFDLEGQLDFETTQQFQEACAKVMRQHGNAGRMVFNLERLRFVGSSGINQFIRVLKSFNVGPERPKYCRVSPEFERLLRAFETTRSPFEVFPNETEALAAFASTPPIPMRLATGATGKKKKKKTAKKKPPAKKKR